MKRSLLNSLAIAACLTTLPVLAQWPEGTPREDTGARPSPMGNPTPREKLDTHRNERGQIVTEQGRVVKGLPEDDSVPNRNMHRTEQDTITADPPHASATPGELE